MRRRGSRVAVHSDVGRSSSTVLSSHGRRSSLVAGVRRHVLRRAVVHRRHSVEVSSSGHTVVRVVASSSSSVTHSIVSFSLNLRLNSFSVRSVPDHRENGANSLDKLSTLSGFGVIESSLNDIVGEGVTKETFKPLLDEKLIDDGASTGSVGDSDTLLDNVRRELLSGESRNVSEELANDSLDESVVVQIENVLNNVVTESVLNEGERVVGNLGDELNTLTLGSVVDTALKDTASVTVSCDFDTVSSDGVVDELVVFGREVVEALLNDVVTVEILDERDDVEIEREDQALNLTLSREEIDHLLNGASSVHVERDGNEFSSDRFNESVTLFVGSVLEETLSEVVGERIRHELSEVREDFVEDHVAVFGVSILEFLLEVTATELILAKRKHISLKIFEPESSETVRAHSTRVPITSRSESSTGSRTIVNESVGIVNVSSGSSSEERSCERVDNVRRSRRRECLGVEVEVRELIVESIDSSHTVGLDS